MASEKKANVSWDKRYQKWDHFDENCDSEEEIVRKPTLFDHSGDENVVVKDVTYISSATADQLKRLDRRDTEVWQVVVRKLRVWTASSEGAPEGKDAIPCRPYCILFNNLYPLGQVIYKTICNPPEKYPSPESILKTTTELMMAPPNTEPQHRPGKIVFPDRTMVGELRKSYASIGIECTYLSESEGIDDYVKEFSRILVQKDMGAVGVSSEKPGLLSMKDVTPKILKGLFNAAALFYKKTPWKVLREQQGIQLHAKGLYVDSMTTVQRGSVWATVLGFTGGVYGIGLFFNRVDMERRVQPKDSKLAYMEDPQLRRCVMCDRTPKQVGKDLKRCTRCQSVFYCNTECQRGHWPTHKKFCSPPNTAKAEMWAAKEVSLLFENRTTLPFDDHDAIDTHQLELAGGEANGNYYPLPIALYNGESGRPEATDLVWLERSMRVFIKMIEDAPLYVEKSIGACLGDDHPPLDVEISTSHCTNSEKIEVRNATVLTVENARLIRERYEALKKEKEEKVDTDDTKIDVNFESGGDSDAAGCNVM